MIELKIESNLGWLRRRLISRSSALAAFCLLLGLPVALPAQRTPVSDDSYRDLTNLNVPSPADLLKQLDQLPGLDVDSRFDPLMDDEFREWVQNELLPNLSQQDREELTDLAQSVLQDQANAGDSGFDMDQASDALRRELQNNPDLERRLTEMVESDPGASEALSEFMDQPTPSTGQGSPNSLNQGTDGTTGPNGANGQNPQQNPGSGQVPPIAGGNDETGRDPGQDPGNGNPDGATGIDPNGDPTGQNTQPQIDNPSSNDPRTGNEQNQGEDGPGTGPGNGNGNNNQGNGEQVSPDAGGNSQPQPNANRNSQRPPDRNGNRPGQDQTNPSEQNESNGNQRSESPSGGQRRPNPNEKFRDRFNRILIDAAKNSVGGSGEDGERGRDGRFDQLLAGIAEDVHERMNDRDTRNRVSSNLQRSRQNRLGGGATPPQFDLGSRSPSFDEPGLEPRTILILIVLGIFGVGIYFATRRWQEKLISAVSVYARSAVHAKALKLPAVETGDDLVTAVDRFVSWRFGVGAHWWHGGVVRQELLVNHPQQQTQIGEMLAAYETARYAPDGRKLTPDQLRQSSATLQHLVAQSQDPESLRSMIGHEDLYSNEFSHLGTPLAFDSSHESKDFRRF